MICQLIVVVIPNILKSHIKKVSNITMALYLEMMVDPMMEEKACSL